jgi:tripartite-type tricarboxylate transporter receptor subunit TctC
MQRGFTRRSALTICAALLGALSPMFAIAAENFPVNAAKIVVPFPAGGRGIDMVARTLAQKMQNLSGQSVIVENRPGAGTVIGTGLVAKSPPDGHTMLIVANSFTINPSIQSRLPYNTGKDFAPVALLTITPHVLAATPTLSANTLQEILDSARRNPGKITYASFGNGTSPHLAGEMMKKLAKIDMTHVPYKGQAEAMPDLLGGNVDLMFGNLPDVLPHIKAGKLKAIAVSDSKRDINLPQVPTMREAGLGALESNSWFGIVAPSGTPTDVIRKLNAVIVKILTMPDVRNNFEAQGLQVIASSPDEFTAWLHKETTKYAEIVQASGARID